MIITGGILAMIGGAIIVTSGYRTGSFLVTVASFSEAKFGSLLPGEALTAIQIGVLVLSFIIGFGGLLAILGGVLVIAKHVTIGKILIGLGGGLGFIGIVISVGTQFTYTAFPCSWTTWTTGSALSSQLWAGILPECPNYSRQPGPRLLSRPFPSQISPAPSQILQERPVPSLRGT